MEERRSSRVECDALSEAELRPDKVKSPGNRRGFVFVVAILQDSAVSCPILSLVENLKDFLLRNKIQRPPIHLTGFMGLALTPNLVAKDSAVFAVACVLEPA